MDHFTPVDTLNASNFLREVVQPDGSAVLHFLMPVTGFEYERQPVTPTGFDKEFGLYPTIDATHPRRVDRRRRCIQRPQRHLMGRP